MLNPQVHIINTWTQHSIVAQTNSDESRLSLRDAAGHELLVRTLAPHSRSFTLSLRHLPSGPYFLSLTSPGATATQKIILR